MVSRRRFIKGLLGVVIGSSVKAINTFATSTSRREGKNWGFVVDTTKCIGCGNCVKACKLENDVPIDKHVYRTWVESYRIKSDDEVEIASPDGGINGFNSVEYKEGEKSFFVPKLCNQCEDPPCVQVCPVGATYSTEDGVILVDRSWCMGCRYCIQACPYKVRFIHPEHKVADKCNWCYHRITKGKLPACVQACPVGARKFGDLNDSESEVSAILKEERIGVLKPDLGTKPRVYYLGLDKEVR